MKRSISTLLISATIFGVSALSVQGSAGEGSTFQQNYIDEMLHPLNDAWLGMRVKTQDGSLIGTVVDATLKDNGDIENIIVDMTKAFVISSDTYLQVPIKYTKLLDSHVELDRSARVKTIES